MMAKRIERVLTTDPGMGVIRHVDAGYDEAKEFAAKTGVKVPMEDYEHLPGRHGGTERRFFLRR
jgi:urocanate hydratase